MNRSLVASFAAAVLAVLLGLSWLLGQDLNWDFLNYHLYGPHLMLEGRWEQDYFAASFQSYLNPLAHVPHYLMVRAGWPALAIGLVLTAFHALNLLLVWQISRQLAAGQQSLMAPVFSVLLALLAPLYLTTAGSSFSDPATSVLVLAAVWLLLGENPAPARVGWAGLLLGAASGLKLTNAVFALAIGASMAAWWLLHRQRATARVVLLAGTGLAGLVLTHGYWSWQLWNTFGNPLFPLFNGLFQSPDFLPDTFRDQRFLGAGWRGLLTLPFEMVSPISWLYSENVSVDFRPAAFVLLVVPGLLLLALRRATDAATRPLLLLTVMLLLSYVLWGLSSKIGRYAMPLWLLLGPLIAAWAQVLLRRPRHVAFACSLLVATQAYALVTAGNPRWSPVRWGDEWLAVDVPQGLRHPITLLTIGNQSFGAVAPSLHPDSRLVNLVGQYVQPAGQRMTPRLRQLMAHPTGAVHVAWRDRSRGPYDGVLSAETRADMDAVLSLYGWRLAARACVPVVLRAEYISGLVTDRKGERENERLHVCPAERLGAAEQARIFGELAGIDRVFDRIEAACGGRLSPSGVQTLRGGKGWLRTYFNSVNTLVSEGEAVYVRPARSMVDVSFGTLADWSAETAPGCMPLPTTAVRPD